MRTRSSNRGAKATGRNTLVTVNEPPVNDPPWLVDVPRIRSLGRRRPGVLWALVPLATLGIGSAPAFVYLSLRYHRMRFFLAAFVYAIATGAAITLMTLAHLLTIGLGIALLLITMGVATAHALAVRGEVAVVVGDNDRHVSAAKERLRRRAEARKLASSDPSLAHELRIGRPDLGGDFDDGGLVDVNHSPVEVLAALPGVDRHVAERIVSARSDLGGFASVDELSVSLDLPPAQLDGIADQLLFL
jgi:DNA uptake protein ComE-like DNA-binding protein